MDGLQLSKVVEMSFVGALEPVHQKQLRRFSGNDIDSQPRVARSFASLLVEVRTTAFSRYVYVYMCDHELTAAITSAEIEPLSLL